MVKERPMKTATSLILLRNPKATHIAPVIVIPPLKALPIPKVGKYFPIIGDTMNTVSSKMPKTNPHSVPEAPFFEASAV